MSQTMRLIGIDFGTSTSVVKVKRYRSGEPIGDSYITNGVTFGNGDADTKASTIVRRNGDGSFTCGADAAETVPNSTIFREFKMELEDQDPEKRQQARELTAAFFQYLYERYDHQRSDLGEIDDEERTLVSLPVKWGEETRRFMAQAAEKAGFRQVSIMDEPTAALYATLCRKMNEINQQGLLRAGESGYLLLVDMGAGTTDLAVCRYTVDSSPGEVIRADRIKNEIVATWPEDRNAATFGGREVDRVLEDYVESYLTDCGLPDAMAAQMVRGAASSSAKLWKETAVSKNLNEGKRVETCAFVSGYMAFLPQQKPFPAFGREEFERMLGNRLEQFRGLVTECLQRASETEPEILAKGLDLVILTGGHSSWYFTEELLNGTMPGLALPQLERVQREKGRVIRLTNPQETVALGLVYSRLPFQVGKKEEPKPEPRAERKEAGTAKQPSEPEPVPAGNWQWNDSLYAYFKPFYEMYQDLPFQVLSYSSSQTEYLFTTMCTSYISIDERGICNRLVDRRVDVKISWSDFLNGSSFRRKMNYAAIWLEGAQGQEHLICGMPSQMSDSELLSQTTEIEDFLRQLQACFRELASSPVSRASEILLKYAPAKKAYPWDDRLLQNLLEFIRQYDPDTRKTLFEYDPDTHKTMSIGRGDNFVLLGAALGVPSNEEVLFAHSEFSPGRGLFLCRTGIYYGHSYREWFKTNYLRWKMSWKEFLNCRIDAENSVLYSRTQKRRLDWATESYEKAAWRFFQELQAYLRKCSMEL